MGIGVKFNSVLGPEVEVVDTVATVTLVMQPAPDELWHRIFAREAEQRFGAENAPSANDMVLMFEVDVVNDIDARLRALEETLRATQEAYVIEAANRDSRGRAVHAAVSEWLDGLNA